MLMNAYYVLIRLRKHTAKTGEKTAAWEGQKILGHTRSHINADLEPEVETATKMV